MAVRNPLVLFVILSLIGIAGCSLSGSSPSLVAPSGDRAILLSQTLVDYDITQANLLIIGKLELPALTELNKVEFHLNADCSDSAIGNGIEKDFESDGLRAQVPSTITSHIYVKTNTVSSCLYLTDYTPNYVAPINPPGVIAQPLSPTRESTTPLIFAEPTPYLDKITLYSDPNCTTTVGSGSNDDLKVGGIRLSLSANTTNKIYAISEEAFGIKSNCEWVYDFKHTTEGPSAPVFMAISPLSPNNFSVNPIIKGAVESSVQTVKLFRDPNCGVMVGEGSGAAFSSDGIRVNLPESSTSDIYTVAYDKSNNPSACTFQVRYIHDASPPEPPQFLGANPPSPTRLTTFPKFIGLASTDTSTVKFFNGITCLNQIGSGTKSVFEGAGIPVIVGFNATTSIYAASVDQAGNSSRCVLLANYRHNTIPPDAPVFNTTNPISPTNKTADPVIYGNTSETALAVSFYSDETCQTNIGNGTAQDFMNSGITIHATPNATTTVYGTAQDLEGNVSNCGPVTNYMHSTAAAPAPGFASTNPRSPSRVSSKPYVIGTAASTISSVFLFSDASCTQLLGTGSRSSFVTIGLSVNLSKNFKTDIYGKSIDTYGNESGCVYLTQYVHDDRVPLNPTFTSTNPTSPNNTSASPLVMGTISDDPLKVLPITQIGIFDSSLCLNRVGVGAPTEFSGIGILAILAPNAINYVYAQTSDDAGNLSACTSLTTYMHSTLPPGKPQFGSVSPNTPSYTSQVYLKGTLGPSTDFLAVAAVDVFSNVGCTNSINSGSLSDFVGSGILLELPKNSTTSIYMQSRDIVGNKSTCQLMVNFVHSDLPPANLIAASNADGSISISWMPDLLASPTPVYRVKRSLTPGGPYTLIQSSVMGNSFKDTMVSANTNYYYRVTATNSTGMSKDSDEVAGTSSPESAISPSGLMATPGNNVITLTWNGFGANASYQVYRSLQTGGPYQAASTTLASTNFDDINVLNGVPYYYVVTGSNASGESFQSQEASAVPLDVPPAPNQLTLFLDEKSSDCGGGPGVHLVWSAGPYDNGYAVFRAGQANNESFRANVAGTEFTDCSPLTNTSDFNENRNYYKVAARWGVLYSNLSNEVVMANMSPSTLKTDSGNGEILIYWTALPSAQSYLLERSTSAVGPFVTYQSGLATTNYLDQGVVNDTVYYYRVSADYGGGHYGWHSAVVSGMPHSNPAAPSNLNLTVLNKQPVLSWTAPSHYAGFKVYRASAAGGPYSYLTRVSSPTYTDTSPLNSMNYYYITSIWGLSETAGSNVVSYRGGMISSLAATANSTSINLTWSALGGVSSYSVWRSSSSGGAYTQINEGSATNYSDATVASGVGYFYVVVGHFIDGTKTQDSNEVSGMRTGTNIPSGLTVISTSGGSVQLAWAKVTNASTYKVYVSTSSGGPFTTSQTTANNTFNYTGLLGQTRYYFKVSAVVSSVESTKSATISAYTYAVPTAPALTIGDNKIDLQWNSVSGATSYTLERTQDGLNFTTIASGIPTVIYADPTVLNNQQYFYRVTASFASGGSTLSPLSAGGIPGIIPISPQGLEVSANGGGTDVSLTWSSILGATSYKVYLATSSGGPWGAAASTVSVANTTLTGLTAGLEYFAVVTAQRGTMESASSPQISFVPEVSPAAPTLSVDSSAHIKLTWLAVPGAASYDILRSINRIEFTTVASSVVTTNYTDAAIVAGQSYVYRYLPKTATGAAMAMSAVSLPGEASVAPLAPQGFDGQAASLTSIALQWVSVSGANSYNLYRATNQAGPYALLQNVLAPNTKYLDNGLVIGSDYSYRLRSVNSLGVESTDSVTVSVSLVSSPTGLVASTVGSGIQLNWNAVGGAIGYRLSRSTVSGGPYGLIYTHSSNTSFVDTNIENGATYYYRVQALSATGGLSEMSGEVSWIGIVSMNLEVPIELTDSSLASSTGSIIFERTRTTLDTDAYDGTVTYKLEIHGRNQDSVIRNVSLVNNADVVVGTIAVAPGSSQITRMTGIVNPTAGFNNYRIALEGTTNDGELEVVSARLLVNQLNATKSKLYFPLLNSYASPNNTDLTNPIASTNQKSLAEIPTTNPFKKESQNLSLIKEVNGWELETLVASTGGAEGTIELYNATQGLTVGNTQGVISSTSITMIRSPFSEGTTGFSSSTNGNLYDVRFKCDQNCSSGQVSVYKAGLWVSLRSLYKVQVFYRMARTMMVSLMTASTSSERTLLDTSAFSHPQVYFQASGYSPMGDSVNIGLVDIGTNDSDVTPAVSVPGSAITLSDSSKAFARVGTPLTVTSGHRFMPEVQINSGSFILLDAGLLVRASP